MKNYFYKLFLVIISIMLVTCKTVQKIPGIYTKKHSYTTLRLNENNTFLYRYKFEFDEKHSSGTWIMNGKHQIILNSSIKSRTLSMRLQTLNENKNGRGILNIKLLNMPDTERIYYNCSIYINNHFYVTKRCDSIYTIQIPLPVHSISFAISGGEKIPNKFIDTLFTEKMTSDLVYANLNVEINYIDSLFNYKIFNNEIIKIGYGRLMFYPTDDNRILLFKKE